MKKKKKKIHKNNILKEEKLKCNKIKVYPSETQRNLLKKWMDVYKNTRYKNCRKFNTNNKQTSE